MEVRRLKLSDIRTDGGTQMRERVSEPTVRLYAELMRDGVDFPPCAVFFDGSDHWLADGFHRLEARLLNGRKTISCEVREGTRREAVLYSISANATHGLPRKRGDKMRAVEFLLRDEEWGRWSNAAVASRAGVSTGYVEGIRRRLMRDGLIGRPDTVVYVKGGEVCEKKNTYGRDTSNDSVNYARDWLKFLAAFDAKQFLRWKALMSGRGNIDRQAAAEAVEVIMRDGARKAAA